MHCRGAEREEQGGDQHVKTPGPPQTQRQRADQVQPQCQKCRSEHAQRRHHPAGTIENIEHLPAVARKIRKANEEGSAGRQSPTTSR